MCSGATIRPFEPIQSKRQEVIDGLLGEYLSVIGNENLVNNEISNYERLIREHKAQIDGLKVRLARVRGEKATVESRLKAAL